MRRYTGEEEGDEENEEVEPGDERIEIQGDYGGWFILNLEKDGIVK